MTPKVLIVDDVNMFVEIQKGFLERSAVTILTARDGAEALKICHAHRPDLVFMDLHMPLMGGAECCAAIKADPQLKGTKVVLITAAGRTDDQALCLKAGCETFLTKPLDRHAYLEAARTYLPQIDRRDNRVNCYIKARFKAFGVTLSGEIRDISPLGVYLAAECELEKDTSIDLLFALPEVDGAIIQAKGRIAWTNSTKTRKKEVLPEGFGVEFIGLMNETREALASYVESQGPR